MILLAIGGCRTAYVPPAAQIPFFRGVGELQAAASIGMMPMQFAVAYSPVEHVGVIATGGSSFHGNGGAKPTYFRFADLMAGYYLRPDSTLHLEIFAGIERGWTGEWWKYSGLNNGFYEISTPDDTLWRTITGNYTRTMVQLNAGLASPPKSAGTPTLELGVSLIISYLQYQSLNQTDTVSDRVPDGLARHPLARNGAIFFDPVLMVRLGDGIVRLEWQIGTAHTPRAVDFNWNAFHAAFGVRAFFDAGRIF